MNKENALVVFSGGQDSTTCLGYALTAFKNVACLTFNYGQRHVIEIDAAQSVLNHFIVQTGRSIPWKVIDIPSYVLRSTSPLVDHNEPLDNYADFETMELVVGDNVEKTFVPMRNQLFLTIAANHAVALGAGVIVTGVCQQDNANYPDCTQPFISSLETTINRSLGLPPSDIEICTPLMSLSKAESVRLAYGLPHTYQALAFSHTAYDGSYPPNGHDHASLLRAKGFEESGLPDPLIVRAFKEGLLKGLPWSANYSKEALLCAGLDQ